MIYMPTNKDPKWSLYSTIKMGSRDHTKEKYVNVEKPKQKRLRLFRITKEDP